MTGTVIEMGSGLVAMVCQAGEGGIAESSRIDPSFAYATHIGTGGERSQLDWWNLVALRAIYQCHRCPHWHTGGTGTGWGIGRKGEIVSNFHVFSEGHNTNIVAIGAMSRDGRCFPIREILAADLERDVATGRIDVHDLPRLPVEIREAVGNAVSVIAHPTGDLFTSEEDDWGVDQGGTWTDTVC